MGIRKNIEKPIERESLARSVRQVLDGKQFIESSSDGGTICYQANRSKYCDIINQTAETLIIFHTDFSTSYVKANL